MKAIILLYLGLEFNSNTFSLCFTSCSCEKMNADQVIKKVVTLQTAHWCSCV